MANQKFGNFIAINGLDTSRFLDGPEFSVMHDHGNELNVFDRVDLKLSSADSVNLGFQFTRSWFQTPNSFDSQMLPPGMAWCSITEASAPTVCR